jgi:transposase-like protein
MNDSWRVDETYVRVKGKWVYLYRAVDSEGATIDFLLSAKRAERTRRLGLQNLTEQAYKALTAGVNQNILLQPANSARSIRCAPECSS